MKPCAVIIAGGRSMRMGRQKIFASIRGRSILDRIVSSLADQVDLLVVNATGDTSRFEAAGLTVIPDLRSDIGTPLAGLHAALRHATATGLREVLTVPSDVPFLPEDLAMRLSRAGGAAAIARSNGQPHYLTGLWSCDLLASIETVLEERSINRLQDWCRFCNAVHVEWSATPYDPFFNVNTPQELAEAERIAEEFAL